MSYKVMRPWFPILLLALVSLWLTGCDGKGFLLPETSLEAGDRPPGGGGRDDGPGGGGGTPPPAARPFAGSWVAAYGDDQVSVDAQSGANQYAVKLVLQQSGQTLSGNGTMFRVLSEGRVASDEVRLRVSGRATGEDATLTLSSVSTGRFENDPFWFLRLASNRIVGMYAETAPTDALVRSGHATWRRVAAADINDTWVAAFSDEIAAQGLDTRDRTAVVTLAEDQDQNLAGQGGFVEQREADVPLELEFDVIQGGRTSREVTFTFGGLDLATNEMDWFSFFNGSLILGAYGQFSEANQLIRLGHGTWRRSPDSGPSAVTHTWVASFGDSTAAEGSQPTDYLAVVSLQAQQGGDVTGNARILDENLRDPAFEEYDVRNATVVGSRLRMELVGATDRLNWDLRLASSVMVGSYHRLDLDDRFLGRGIAEWRFSSANDLVGTWAASFYDTFGDTRPETTHFALVTITAHENDGTLSGVGTLRFAGEQTRRLFNVLGEIDNDDIRWVWRGPDLFGDTVWHLRQAGRFIFGTYTNLDSVGNVETQGNALWIRTAQTETFSR